MDAALAFFPFKGSGDRLGENVFSSEFKEGRKR